MKVKNPMSSTRVLKVVVNMGTGDLKDDREEREKVIGEFASIVGQRPQVRPARKSISGFGVRKGEPVGLSATLRGKRMHIFLEKLFNVVLPRLRDFKGVSRTSFDQNANYTIGITEHTVFPEVDLGKVGRVRGLEITFVTSTTAKTEAIKLFEELGMPFEKE